MSNKNVALSDKEQALFNFLFGVGVGKDVPIANCYALLYTNHDISNLPRTFQQYVGSTVSKINRKRHDYQIVPGELKRTYRLIAKA